MIKSRLRDRAKELGFDAVGFCSAERLGGMEELLRKRRRLGFESDFEEKDIERRIDPRVVMSGARTVIVAAVAYAPVSGTDSAVREEEGLRGVMSRSSLGPDYHVVLSGMLEQLARELCGEADGKYRVFVDTGPLLEREFAKRAGLGWQGKNCCLVSPELGSYFSLGCILTDLEIEPDAPAAYSASNCGDCSRCLDACPTGALREPWQLDAQRCVSFLTQKRGKLEPARMRQMGCSIYGCDRCQEVCPYNQRSNHDGSSVFASLPVPRRPRLANIASMTDREFQETFGVTAAGWRGRRTIRRNAVIALGNSGRPEALEILAGLLRDPSSVLRWTAAWAIRELAFPGGRELLRSALAAEKCPDVKKMMSRV